MSAFLHVPFPEELSERDWMRRKYQIDWLAEKGMLKGEGGPMQAVLGLLQNMFGG